MPESGRPLRILFVAQAVSIHTARWISQVNDQGWDLHLFDMLGSFPHAELGGVTEYSLLFPRRIPAAARCSRPTVIRSSCSTVGIRFRCRCWASSRDGLFRSRVSAALPASSERFART